MTDPDSLQADVPLVLAIVNARVWTGDARRRWADAVLVRGDTVVAVGGSAELRKRAGPGASTIEAGGRLLLPLEAGARLAPGERSDLAIVERDVDADASVDASAATDADRVIFQLAGGRVVVDRESLLRAPS